MTCHCFQYQPPEWEPLSASMSLKALLAYAGDYVQYRGPYSCVEGFVTGAAVNKDHSLAMIRIREPHQRPTAMGRWFSAIRCRKLARMRGVE